MYHHRLIYLFLVVRDQHHQFAYVYDTIMVEINQIRHGHQSSAKFIHHEHMTYVVFSRIYDQFPVPQNGLAGHIMCIYRDL